MLQFIVVLVITLVDHEAQNLIITGFGTGTISTSVIAGFAATSGISTNANNIDVDFN